ncbi:MAG: hypothetical protein ABS58_02680 [Mesorhizobium sp. SCN 65-20]|nr:MAG: hypothetical protein ABS58_02680 [Mesorhizobium sp. SCN 65-20]
MNGAGSFARAREHSMPVESMDARRSSQPIGRPGEQASVATYVHVPTTPVAIIGVKAAEASDRPSLSGLDDAHRTALSALRNDRFREALDRLADMRIPDALSAVRPAQSAGTDTRSAIARYQENS